MVFVSDPFALVDDGASEQLYVARTRPPHQPLAWLKDPILTCAWQHRRPLVHALLCRFAALEGRMVTINSSPTNRAWVQECYGQVGGIELRGVIAASRQ